MAVASRRAFLERALWAGAASSTVGLVPDRARPGPSRVRTRASRPCAELFPDLSRHFIFEYYPWYGGPPDYVHWDYLDRHPPDDIASNFVPRLGPYDVTSFATLEQHARWINRVRSRGDRPVLVGPRQLHGPRGPADHGRDARPRHQGHVRDGALRGRPWPALRGRRALPDRRATASSAGSTRSCCCATRTARRARSSRASAASCPSPRPTAAAGPRDPSDFTSDATWRQQTDRLRNTLRGDFDHITLLADSLEFARTPASGFDGIGIYDNFIAPERYRALAEGASRAGLVFSFNVNPGYDQIEPRIAPPRARPRPIPPILATRRDPPRPPRASSTGRGPRSARRRPRPPATGSATSFEATVEVQTDATLTNARRGLLPRLHQLLQRVARRTRLRAHEGRGRPPARGAALRLPQPGARRLPSDHRWPGS